MGERLTFTFSLTGRREWGHGTQGVALGMLWTYWAFSPRLAARMSRTCGASAPEGG